jgi:hypothetical protein
MRTHSENEIDEKPTDGFGPIRDKNWAIRSDQNFQATIYEEEGHRLNMMGGKIPMTVEIVYDDYTESPGETNFSTPQNAPVANPLGQSDIVIFDELEISHTESQRSVRDLTQKVLNSNCGKSGSMMVQPTDQGGGNLVGTEEDTQGESASRSDWKIDELNTMDLEREAKKKILGKSGLKKEVDLETQNIKECSEALESSPLRPGKKALLYDKTDGVYKIGIDTGDTEQKFDKELKKVARKSMLNFLDMFTGEDEDKKKKKSSKKRRKTKPDI